MKFQIKVDGDTYEVEVDVAAPEQPQPGFVPPSGGRYTPAVAAPSRASSGPVDEKVDDESKVCRSPISGLVIRVDAEVGQSIEPDQTLMALEAIKMETVITAPIAGKILKINRAAGDPVKAGQVLIEFECCVCRTIVSIVPRNRRLRDRRRTSIKHPINVRSTGRVAYGETGDH